jgi:hypothetical protein
VVGLRLENERGSRREHRLVDVAELVHARPDVPPPLVVDEDLVLDVGPALQAPIAPRSDRQIEAVIAEVPAVGEDLARANRVDVAEFPVVGLRVEREGNGQAVRADRQQAVGVAVEDVREEVELQRAARMRIVP